MTLSTYDCNFAPEVVFNFSSLDRVWGVLVNDLGKFYVRVSEIPSLVRS